MESLPKAKMRSLYLKLWLFSGLFLAILAASGCQGTGPVGTPIERTEPEKTASQQMEEQASSLRERKLIGAFGGQLIFRNLKLTIPSRAISADAYVQVQMATDAPEGFVRESAYLLTPNDLVLAKPALLAIHYFDDDLAADESEDDITIVQEISGQWMPLAAVSLDTYNNVASTRITKFATYALQVIPHEAPFINEPPVARLTYDLVTAEEAAAKEKAAEEGAAQQVPPAAAEPLAGEARQEALAGAPKTEAPATETPAEATGAEAQPEPVHPPPEDAGSAQSSEKQSPTRGEGEVSAGAGEATGTEGQASGKTEETGVEPEVPPERLVEPPAAEPGKRGFLVEQEPTPEKPPPEPGYTVEYSAEESTDEDGKIAGYFWDLDADGVIDEVSSQPQVTQHYDTYGSVLTVLRVEDDQQPVGSDIAFAAVELPKGAADPVMPLAVHAMVFPAQQRVDGKVVVGASVTGGAPPYSFAWELPEGQTSDEQAVLLRFDSPGKRTLKLTLRDAEGVEVHRQVAAEILPASRMAEGRIRLRLKPMSVSLARPGDASFSVEVRNGQPPYRLEIDTGVGEPITAEQTDFSVRFENAGYYILTVLLTDVQGRSDKAFVPVSVGADEEEALAGVQPALGRPSFVPEFARDGLEVVFKPREVPRGASVSWDFGDGTQSRVGSPKKRYARPGVYRVRMTVSDGFRTYERERTVPVGGGELMASIDLPATLLGIAPFTLKPRAIVNGGVFPLFYRWKVSDLFGEGERPRFILDQPGEYQLQLTVSDGKGTSFDTDPVKVRVFRAPPAYRYPIAFVQRDEKANMLQIKLTEFDGSARTAFPPFVANPQEVELSPGGRMLAVSSAGGFHLYQLGNGTEVFSFAPSHGRVASLQLATSPEVFAFNLETDLGTRGYLYQKESGIVPVGGDGERVLDITPDGKAILTLDREGLARLFRLDPFTGSVGKPMQMMKGVVEGKLLGDASSAVLLGSDNQVYSVAVSTGERAQLTADSSRKFNLRVSLSGSVVAYNLEGGEIVVAQDLSSTGGAPSFPLNISRLNGFTPSGWRLSPDGKLLVGYGSFEGSEGLFLVDLSHDLTKATAQELAPHFLAESTPQFAVGASLKPFDQLLAPVEEGTTEPSATE